MTSASLRGWIIGFVLLMTLFGASLARADQPTIERGREADVLSLLAPYQLGAEITDDWKLWNVSIQPTRIQLGLRGPAEVDVAIVLVHPTQADSDAIRTPSFALRDRRLEVPQAAAARDALLQAIRQNDNGKFWRITRPVSPTPGFELPKFRIQGLHSDGFVLSVLGALLTIALALHVLVSAPRVVRIGLPLVVALGIALRLQLSPEGFLGAWPWSRIWPNVGIIWTSPAFGALASYFGKELYFTDVILAVNFVYACLMPVVLFAHASQLLRDTRAGLAAAAIVAVSPHHIRFSRCEDAFVPSLVLTSLAFALIHTFMRDPSRRWRWIALAALPFALWSGYLLRPLNILFVVIYLGAVVLLHPEHSPLRRRVLVGLVVGGVWVAAFSEFLRMHHAQVADAATDPFWLLGVPLTLIWPRWNMLIHPLVTPPAVLILAVLGTRWLKKRGETRLAVFLVGWLAIFFVAHGYVVSTPMQPRYHLHLLVPFTLLASTAVVEAFRRSRRGFALAAVSVALAPWIGSGWIRDVGYSDMVEYDFVRKARDLVPEGCTVVEYVDDAPELDRDSRFRRISQRLTNKQFTERFSTVMAHSSATPGSEGLDAAAREALSPKDDACVYVYEGLRCWGQKHRDETYAPTCAAMVQAAPLETVLELRTPFRPYDDNVTRGVTPGTDSLRIALSRVVPREKLADIP